MIRCLIISDNSQEISRLKDFLENMDDVQVVGEMSSASEAIKVARELQPDIAFFDLDVSGADGLEAPRQFDNEMKEDWCPPFIALVCRDTRYAIEGYSVNGVAYILKAYMYVEVPAEIIRLRPKIYDRQRLRIGR